MDKIEKIKEWVKKQKKEELARNSIGVITGKALFVDANELLSFLDTLSEEPDKSLEEEIKKEMVKLPFFIRGKDQVAFARHFAEWGASQMPMPEDTILFNKGVAEGRRLEREDMLKDAVEAKTFYLPFGKWRVTALVGKDKIEEGDKVRIVVLKEEEE